VVGQVVVRTLVVMPPAAPPWGNDPVPDTLAAIDIGTNSVHMLIARLAPDGRFEVITRQKEMVRLGSGRGEMKHLEPDAIDRGIAALDRCRSLADSFGAPIVAVATSAVREAENSQDFLRRARDEAGVEVEVISGYEEARLIQLGVVQALPVFDQRLLLVDVGGGSTEVLFGERGEVASTRSVKLGSLRMTRRCFPGGVVEPGSLQRARESVRAGIAPLVHEVESLAHDVAVATSGTAETLARMAIEAQGEPAPQSMNAATMTAGELTSVVESLAAAPTPEQRRRLPGMDAARADILLGGAVVLEQVGLALGVQQWTISDYALREGVLLDAVHRLGGGTLHHLSDLRRRSVFHLMELCDDDPDHSLQVARLALVLHDRLGERLGLGDAERELLEAAALLSNVGLFISHSKHHKHSYYVIRNSEHLMGFTDREIELIALVARYHRKSAPSVDKHPEFAALADADREHVRSMSALLRVAIGGDRNHDGAVETIEVDDAGDVVRLRLVASDPDTDLTLERYSAEARGELLADRLGAKLSVEV
jgi:exopolyphosphatase / guanosine-5'-triphosphate,3'-diphosphate pyrophosphatase